MGFLYQHLVTLQVNHISGLTHTLLSRGCRVLQCPVLDDEAGQRLGAEVLLRAAHKVTDCRTLPLRDVDRESKVDHFQTSLDEKKIGRLDVGVHDVVFVD